MAYPVIDGHATLPDGLSKIPKSAFRGDATLRSVSAPSVKIIGPNAFTRAAALTQVNLVGLEEVEREAFSHCSALETMELPDSLKRIGEGAFSHCGNLTSLTIPASVERIEGWAFWGCNKLNVVSISSSTKLGDFAFPLHTKITISRMSGVWEAAAPEAPSSPPKGAAPHEAELALGPPSSEVSIEIPEYRLRPDDVTVYKIVSVTPGGTFEVERRYTAFRDLHDKLAPTMAERVPLAFPVWKTYVWRERRMRQLEAYLRDMIVAVDGELPAALATFLGVPASTTHTSAPSSSASAASASDGATAAASID